MKTYLKLILGAIVIGGLFAFLFYLDINKEVEAITKNENNLYLFQVGVFQNEDNALKYASNYKSRYIYQEDDLNRVLICITSTEENKEKLTTYYKDNNYNFYIKKLIMKESISKELEANEIMLKKTDEKEAIDVLCQKQLDIFALYF